MLDALTVQTGLPDAKCIDTGDDFVQLAVRCFAAAGLSNPAIARRLLRCVVLDPPFRHDDAARAFAIHCATNYVPKREILACMAWLAAKVPAWPIPEEVAFIVRSALAEEAGS